MFDDGSRIMQDDGEPATATASSEPSSSPKMPSAIVRGNTSLEVYYEIDRVAKEVVDKLDWSENTSRGQLWKQVLAYCVGNGTGNGDGAPAAGDKDGDTTSNEKSNSSAANKTSEVADDGFLCRIALQFPDELLGDAPDVSWLMETAIANALKEKLLGPLLQHRDDTTSTSQSLMEQCNQHLQQFPLLFILGDTTYGSCCPDEVSANHLNACLIVHYGYACLSPTESVPVVYAFGVSKRIDDNNANVWKTCVDLVCDEALCKEGDGKEGKEDVEEAMEQLNIANQEESKRKLLILYEVKYHHAMNALKAEFDEKKTNPFQVIVGTIPKQQLSIGRTAAGMNKRIGECGSGACGKEECVSNCDKPSEACCASKEESQSNEQSCGAKNESQSCCTKDDGAGASCNLPDAMMSEQGNDEDTLVGNNKMVEKQCIPRTIGGLEISDDLDLSQCTLLYIGDDLNIDSHDGNSRTRLLHILLRCNAPDGTQSIWSYSPMHRSLNTDVLNAPLSTTNSTSLSTVLSRILRRRYFLVNKAKLATTIAILIGTTSNSYSFRKLLSRTRHRIQSTGRTAYTFAVGKLSSSASKLANFAEIDCFVLIACGESVASFWQMERENMLVPVLTPLELDVALGVREWDGRYSCDFGDLIRWDEADGIEEDEYGDLQHTGRTSKGTLNDDSDDGNDSSDDEPFFSMISGKYEQLKSATKQSNDLEALPGQGKLVEYRSEAAEFLKQREYRGLEANVGETEAKAAVLGMVGIASNYGE